MAAIRRPLRSRATPGPGAEGSGPSTSAEPRALSPEPCSTIALLGLDTPQIVNDVPDVVIRHLALVALHVELRARAVLDDEKDFAVGGTTIPFIVRQIGRVRAFGRHRAVALRVRTVAEPAVLLERRLAR